MADTADSGGKESDIRELDDRTVRQIAAGEVVERPASVVKELVENALDAGADRIAVRIEGDGTGLIRVRDDGHGMGGADLEGAVAEHATSKIESVDDLDAVGSLGFRGEALHTIAAVSRLTLRSRPPDTDQGHELVVEGGDPGEVRPAGCPPGTVVEVEDLFYNTPARRKFLRSETTEFDRINSVVTQYALANPDVAVSLEHDDRETFATDGRGELRTAVLAVYGREVAESMIEVEGETGEIRISGLVSHPETTRSSREYLSTFVNGRYVPASDLRRAVIDAYGGQLAADRYPFAVLEVDLRTEAVDVNVHPRKTEVRFDDAERVTDALEGTVRTALLNHGLVRSTAPRGRSAPDEAAVAPGADDRRERRETDAERDQDGVPDEPSVAVETDGEPTSKPGGDGEQPGRATAPTTEAEAAAGGWTDRGTGRTGSEGTTPVSDELDAASSEAASDELDAASSEAASDERDAAPSEAASEGASSGTASNGTSSSETASNGTAGGRSGRSRAAVEQLTLSGDERGTETFERLPEMQILGQVHDSYVVAETTEGLVLVDQHAADERVNYERLRSAVTEDTPTQALAEPVDLELTAREAALFEDHRESLGALGFRAERTGERTVSVRSVPAVLGTTFEPALLRDALDDLAAGDDGRTVEAAVDDLLADLACYPSVTGNTSLSEGSVLDLLAALDDCTDPYACPHGRPTMVKLDRDELAARFERDYPGHGGRRPE